MTDVYFLQDLDTGYLTIDVTDNLQEYLLDINKNKKNQWKVLGIIKDSGQETIDYIQEVYSKDYLYENYYRHTPELLTYIRQHTQPYKNSN